MTPPESPPAGDRRLVLPLALVLALLAGLLYARTADQDFVNLDDPGYVSEHPVVREGLTAEGLRLAFTGPHASNWHPLTTLSHMLDAELYGVTALGAAGGHHRTNLLLHALNAGLAFLLLLRLIGGLWAPWAGAALFALHPLRVESVAWISERKDVLSGAFFLLTLLAWCAYARRGGLARYLIVALLFALGLMAKPMLVTVPFVLVLLDAWPLGRWRGAPGNAGKGRGLGPLVVEKVPLFALALGAAFLTWRAQSATQTIGDLESLSLGARLVTALGAPARYLAATLWPAGLAAFYPHPLLSGAERLTTWTLPAVAGGLVVLGMVLVARRTWRRFPALSVGGFWFLGMLVPVAGLVQVGSQSHADRYTYLPSLGLSLVLAALLRRRAVESHGRTVVPAVAVGLVLALCAWRTWVQVGTWRDSRTLCEHAIAVTERNFLAHNNLGIYYLNEVADPVRAVEELERALEIYPGYALARENLGIALLKLQRPLEAMAAFRELLARHPEHARATARLARLEARFGEEETAVGLWRRATELEPDEASHWIGLVDLQPREKAMSTLREVLGRHPDHTGVMARLAQLEERYGDEDVALRLRTRATELEPDEPGHWVDLGNLRLAREEGIYAEECAERALELDEDLGAAHVLHAHAARMLNYSAAALQRIELGVERAPDSSAVRMAYARILADQGRVTEAEGEARRALELEPELADAFILLSKLALVRDERETARGLLEQALVVEPDDAEANELLAVMYHGESRTREAEVRFLRALELRPGYPSALSNLGVLYEGEGRERDALARYLEVLEVAADSPVAKNAAARAAWILATSPDTALHDGAEAVRLALFALRRFEQEDPRNLLPYVTLAAALARDGRWEEAVQAQEHCLSLASGDRQRAVLGARLEQFRDQVPFQRPGS